MALDRGTAAYLVAAGADAFAWGFSDGSSVRPHLPKPAKENEAKLVVLPSGEKTWVGYIPYNDPTFGNDCTTRWIRRAKPSNIQDGTFVIGDLVKSEMLCPRSAATINAPGLAAMPSGEIVWAGRYPERGGGNCAYEWARSTHDDAAGLDNDKIVVENNVVVSGRACPDRKPHFTRAVYLGHQEP